MRATRLFITAVFSAGCSSKKPATEVMDFDPMLSMRSGDTLKILYNAAVFYAPDSVRLAQIKKTLGADTFRIALDDYAAAANEADKYLESASISIVKTGNQKYLQFEGDNNTSTLIKLDTLRDYWGLYFFVPNKKPKLVDEMDIEKAYNDYFKPGK